MKGFCLKRISYSPGLIWTCYVVEDDFELTLILLSLPPKFWGYSLSPPLTPQLLLCGAGEQTQSPVQAKHTLYQLA